MPLDFTSRACHRYLLIGLFSLSSIPVISAQTLSGGSRAQKQSAQQMEQEIAERYLSAYRLNKESEDAALKNNWRLAIQKAQQAERILAGIVRDHPLWRQKLVQMRRKLIAQNIAQYREKAKNTSIGVVRDPNLAQPIPSHLEQGPIDSDSLNRGGALPQVSATDVSVPPTVDTEPSPTPDITPGLIANNKQLYNELMRTKEELRRMAEAYKTLRQQHDEAQKSLNVANYNHNLYKERYDELKRSIEIERKAGNEVVKSLNQQLLDLEEKYRLSELARQDAVDRADKLSDELGQLQIEHERVVRERDSLSEENERLREIVELNSPEKIKSLLDQNISLSTQLDAANKKIDELNAQLVAQGDENSVLSQQLEAARGEAERLNQEIARIYDENRGYRRRISELNKLTQDLESDLLEQETEPSMDPAIQEENELLRSIVDKQKRTIKSQQEARHVLIETYKQIKNQDPALVQALQTLDEESSIELTELEDALIRAVTEQAAGEGDQEQAQAEADSRAAIRAGLEMEALANGAAKAFKNQRYTAAEQLYRTLVEANPDHLAGLINFGTILLYRNKCEEALEYLERARRLAPDLAIGYFMSGTARYRLNKLNEAAQDFIRTLDLDPANADAFFYLANIEGLNGEHELALKHFAAALKLNPKLADAHYNMAHIYIELGQLANAARSYDRAVHAGSQPDLELEAYLRAHKAGEEELGSDLVSEIKPLDVVQELRVNEEMKQREVVAENKKKYQELLESDGSVADLSQALAIEVKAAPTPSPAAKGHELGEGAFSSKTIRVKGKKRKLRVKQAPEMELRLRGGVLMPKGEEKVRES
ncbi:MAG: tetratricopeptide repeat protein [Akkermansia sp.]